MTLHDALFPWATPRKLALFLSALAACLIFGDSTYGDVALAIDPVTLGLMYAGGKLIGGIGKAVQGYQAKKGVEAIEGSEGFKTTQTLGKEAGERLKAGEYGDSAAGKRQQLGEIVRAQEGATRGSREQAKRSIQAQGGYGRSGRALAALRDVVTGGRAETVAKGASAKGQMYGGAMGAAGEPVSAYAQSQISARAYEKKPGTTTQDEFLKLDRG